MLCCGKKNDIPKNQTSTLTKANSSNNLGAHNNIRATKFYGADDTNATVNARDFTLVKNSSIKGVSRVTRAENYAVENTKITSSRIGDIKQLDFSLDEESGVANTFDLPTFDYATVLTHNVYANKNSSVELPEEQGYKKNNQQQQQQVRINTQ